MSRPPARLRSILLIRLPGLLARSRFRRSQVRFRCYFDCTKKRCTQLTLEYPGNLRLSTWTKRDTCPRASNDLAKRPVQAAGHFRLAELVQDQECSDNLLRPDEGRSHRASIVAPIDWGLRNSTHRTREAPQGQACHILACLYRP